MKIKTPCLVCQSLDQLESFKWSHYNIIHCKNCQLDFCSEMIEKEEGGNSSPVHLEGIAMMANSYYKTEKLSKFYAIKRKKLYEKFLNRNCKKVLEVGCGPGVFFKPWKELNVDWVGIDINPYWKEFGAQNKVPISNVSTDFLSEKYDVIMAHQVIEHVEKPILFMKSIKKLLNPGGLIHLELPNQDSFTASLRKISSNLSYDYGFIQPPMHLRAYRVKTIKYLFNNLDLDSKIVFARGNNDRIWGQVRDYSFKQKLFYSFTGKIGLGSLLVALAQLKTNK